jgi:hypothetical protein
MTREIERKEKTEGKIPEGPQSFSLLSLSGKKKRMWAHGCN